MHMVTIEKNRDHLSNILQAFCARVQRQSKIAQNSVVFHQMLNEVRLLFDLVFLRTGNLFNFFSQNFLNQFWKKFSGSFQKFMPASHHSLNLIQFSHTTDSLLESLCTEVKAFDIASAEEEKGEMEKRVENMGMSALNNIFFRKILQKL